jgi:hypothetical protein
VEIHVLIQTAYFAGKGKTLSNKPLTQNDIIKIAAEAGAKAGLERFQEETARQRRKTMDMKLRNTKKLMHHYRDIKINSKDAISTLEQAQIEDFDYFKTIMEGNTCIDVKAIAAAKLRSFIMIAHTDAMLKALEEICYASKDDTEARRYRVLEGLYIAEDKRSATAIADAEGVDVRTVYRDLDTILEKLSSMLFGIPAVEE